MWSPRRLAELAGTSRRTVRYYDEIGLLPKPDRRINGYGRYGVDHLIRLLRIRQLTELGLSLPQVAEVGDADRPPEHMMRGLDAELVERIERMRRVRADLSVMLTRPGPFDLPIEVEQQLTGVPSNERTLVVVLSRLLDPPALSVYVGLLARYRDDAAVHIFDQLAPDADSRVRAAVAERLEGHLRQITSRYADDVTLIERALRQGSPPKQHTVNEVVHQLYNPAQLDVLARLRADQPSVHGRPISPETCPERELVDSHQGSPLAT